MAKVIVEIDGKDTTRRAFDGVDSRVKKLGQSTLNLATLTTGLNSAMSIGLQVFNMVSDTVSKTYSEYAKLSEQVRDLSLVSGTSAEETSRFIQVLDDYQLTAEDATTASRFLKEKGLAPTIDTLVMLADQFKQIEDPAQRLEFIQENLGRGGAKWVNILNQEGDALRDAAAAIDQNLILSDEQIEKYEQQRLALDAVGDSVQAAKVATGSFIGSLILENQVMIRANEIYEETTGRVHVLGRDTERFKEAVIQARREQEEQTSAMMRNSEAAAQNEMAMEDLIAKQKELSDFLSGQVGLINNIQAADERYTEQAQTLAEQRGEAETKLAVLRAQGWWEQSTQIQDQLAKIEEIKTKEAELAEERAKQSLQFISNILAEQLARDGWTQTEFEAFAKQQEAWGLWSANAVSAAQAAWQEADKITASINAIPTNKGVTVTINTLGGYEQGTEGYNNIAYAGRDSGGYGEAGQGYIIGRGAQPEAFFPNTNGTFVPNIDRKMGGGWDDSRIVAAIQASRINEDRMVRVLRDAIMQAGGVG